jgi:hypothetical protein
MTQTIDPIKLNAAAEQLEWVLQQYPESEDAQDLLLALTPLIVEAKASRIEHPVDSAQVPGAYNFGDGRYVPFKDPSVDEAYTRFRVELRGGLTQRERERHARMQRVWEAVQQEPSP